MKLKKLIFALVIMCSGITGCTLAMNSTAPDGTVSSKSYSLHLDVSGISSQLPSIISAVGAKSCVSASKVEEVK